MFDVQPFPPFPQLAPRLRTVPVPNGLPSPVARFFRQVFGAEMPVIHSAVVSGRGHIRIMGVTLPVRWRFVHEAGRSYRHYIEAMALGRPLMRVNERYVDGHSLFEMPFGVVDDQPKTNSAANLGLWAESLFLPSVYLTDKRVRWEAIDDTSAALYVPFEDREDKFVAVFDAESGLLRYLETMRYRSESATEKVGWRAEAMNWKQIEGILLPTLNMAHWMDQSAPWLVMTLEEVVYDVDVSQYLRQKGI